MKRLGTFLYNNKTKITGFLLALAGTLQANEAAFEVLLTPKQFALFTIFIGVAVMALGFVNSVKPTLQK